MDKKKRQLAQRISETIELLRQLYPDARCSLNYTNPFELLVATIMSAQSTDIRVNKVTAELFKRYRCIEEYAAATAEDIAAIIRTVGCYRVKAANIVKAARIISTEMGGEVPQTLEQLVTLPGVGRKTANVVLSNAFNVAGFPVDTHVKRLARRLGWTSSTDPVKIEQQLCALIEAKQWGHTSHLLIYHGRACCTARGPRCDLCQIKHLCDQNI